MVLVCRRPQMYWAVFQRNQTSSVEVGGEMVDGAIGKE